MNRTFRSRLHGPAEGWLSLFLVAVLAVTVAWSLDDAGLVLGQRNLTHFLPWMAVAGVATGFLGAHAGWNRPVAHLVGAAFAALIVPLVVGSVLDPTGSPGARYQATADASVNAVLDFAVRGLPVTRETGHYLLVLGMLCWANGQFAASAVFRQGRPIGAIIVLGTVLVANMSATLDDQIWLLVLFSMAALFLLTRLHALDERATWVRRRIGDPRTVGSLYLRGGTVFIAIAIFGSLALTATARSAPLAGFWDDARPALVDVSQWLQRLIPAAPGARNLGIVTFGPQVTIGGTWSTANEPALEIFRAPGDDRPFYWRATTYDTFNLFGWTSTDLQQSSRPKSTPILDGTLDAIPATAARVPEQFRIVPQSNLYPVVFSPVDPVAVDQDTTLTTVGPDGWFQSVGVATHTSYTVSAMVPKLADVAGGVTENRLRAAGQDYPADVVDRYTDYPSAAMGPFAKQLLADIKAGMKPATRTNPYDLANAIVSKLHDQSVFSYKTDVSGVCSNEVSIVECFARYKVGFCEHFATTMAILLRAEGVPARLAQGFLPGDLDVATGRERIATGSAHAWVEVFFPGIGWYPFDPTASLARTEPIQAGTPQAIPTPSPRASIATGSGAGRDQPDRFGSRGPVVGSGPTTTTPGSNTGAFVAIALLLLVAVVLAAFLAWRRGPRGITTPDGVYTSVSSLARRFGFGPRPTQTAYEYANALGDILPGVRPELHTVASAKVEVAYGRRELGDDRLQALRDSYRRLRVAMLRLAFRRSDRRRLR